MDTEETVGSVCLDFVNGKTNAKAQGAIIMTEPEDGFWGGRIYRARDLEGHQWEFSQRGRDRVATGWQLPPGLKRGAAE